MDGQVESFGRDIKANVYGERAVLVRMRLAERDDLRRRAIASGMSLQQYCRQLLGLPSRLYVKKNCEQLAPEQQPPTENSSEN